MFRTIKNDTFQDALKSAGYSQWKPPMCDRYDLLFQRRIKDSSKTLYFINVRYWDFSKYERSEARVSYDVYVCFYNKDGPFRIEFSIDITDTVEKVESKFAEFYKNNNCVPDIHND